MISYLGILFGLAVDIKMLCARTVRPVHTTMCAALLQRGMAGHSKWKTIKHAKSSNDQKRAALFTKIGREIMSSARLCAGDLANPRLASAIAKAKVDLVCN